MGVKVWIYSDIGSGCYFMMDTETFGGAGPIEISHETFEFIREAEKAFNAAQNILSELEYEWKYPDE